MPKKKSIKKAKSPDITMGELTETVLSAYRDSLINVLLIEPRDIPLYRRRLMAIPAAHRQQVLADSELKSAVIRFTHKNHPKHLPVLLASLLAIEEVALLGSWLSKDYESVAELPVYNIEPNPDFKYWQSLLTPLFEARHLSFGALSALVAQARINHDYALIEFIIDQLADASPSIKPKLIKISPLELDGLQNMMRAARDLHIVMHLYNRLTSGRYKIPVLKVLDAALTGRDKSDLLHYMMQESCELDAEEDILEARAKPEAAKSASIIELEALLGERDSASVTRAAAPQSLIATLSHKLIHSADKEVSLSFRNMFVLENYVWLIAKDRLHASEFTIGPLPEKVAILQAKLSQLSAVALGRLRDDFLLWRLTHIHKIALSPWEMAIELNIPEMLEGLVAEVSETQLLALVESNFLWKIFASTHMQASEHGSELLSMVGQTNRCLSVFLAALKNKFSTVTPALKTQFALLLAATMVKAAYQTNKHYSVAMISAFDEWVSEHIKALDFFKLGSNQFCLLHYVAMATQKNLLLKVADHLIAVGKERELHEQLCAQLQSFELHPTDLISQRTKKFLEVMMALDLLKIKVITIPSASKVSAAKPSSVLAAEPKAESDSDQHLKAILGMVKTLDRATPDKAELAHYLTHSLLSNYKLNQFGLILQREIAKAQKQLGADIDSLNDYHNQLERFAGYLLSQLGDGWSEVLARSVDADLYEAASLSCSPFERNYLVFNTLFLLHHGLMGKASHLKKHQREENAKRYAEAYRSLLELMKAFTRPQAETFWRLYIMVNVAYQLPSTRTHHKESYKQTRSLLLELMEALGALPESDDAMLWKVAQDHAYFASLFPGEWHAPKEARTSRASLLETKPKVVPKVRVLKTSSGAGGSLKKLASPKPQDSIVIAETALPAIRFDEVYPELNEYLIKLRQVNQVLVAQLRALPIAAQPAELAKAYEVCVTLIHKLETDLYSLQTYPTAPLIWDAGVGALGSALARIMQHFETEIKAYLTEWYNVLVLCHDQVKVAMGYTVSPQNASVRLNICLVADYFQSLILDFPELKEAVVEPVLPAMEASDKLLTANASEAGVLSSSIIDDLLNASAGSYSSISTSDEVEALELSTQLPKACQEFLTWLPILKQQLIECYYALNAFVAWEWARLRQQALLSWLSLIDYCALIIAEPFGLREYAFPAPYAAIAPTEAPGRANPWVANQLNGLEKQWNQGILASVNAWQAVTPSHSADRLLAATDFLASTYMCYNVDMVLSPFVKLFVDQNLELIGTRIFDPANARDYDLRLFWPHEGESMSEDALRDAAQTVKRQVITGLAVQLVPLVQCELKASKHYAQLTLSIELMGWQYSVDINLYPEAQLRRGRLALTEDGVVSLAMPVNDLKSGRVTVAHSIMEQIMLHQVSADPEILSLDSASKLKLALRVWVRNIAQFELFAQAISPADKHKAKLMGGLEPIGAFATLLAELHTLRDLPKENWRRRRLWTALEFIYSQYAHERKLQYDRAYASIGLAVSTFIVDGKECLKLYDMRKRLISETAMPSSAALFMPGSAVQHQASEKWSCEKRV